jgi:hypothetical protein
VNAGGLNGSVGDLVETLLPHPGERREKAWRVAGENSEKKRVLPPERGVRDGSICVKLKDRELKVRSYE